MEATVVWKDRMCFEGRADEFSFTMDATPPLGHHEGVQPNKMLLSALAASAGMDIIGHLKKNRQKVDRFEIEVEAGSSSDHPVIFTSIELFFKVEGLVDTTIALNAAELSQTTYCGISAMLSKNCPIKWNLFVNDVHVGDGRANFNFFRDVFQSSFEG